MIQKISIENFKSIKRLKDFELKPINVLIGANNSGKSNFLDAFRFTQFFAKPFFSNSTSKEFHDQPVTNSDFLLTVLNRDGLNRFKYDGEALSDVNIKYSKNINDSSRTFHLNMKYENGLDTLITLAKDRDEDIKEFKIYAKDWDEDIKGFKIYNFFVHNQSKQRIPLLMHTVNVLDEDGGNLVNVLNTLCQTDSDFKERMSKRLKFVYPYFESLTFPPDVGGLGYTFGVWKERGFEKPFDLKQVSDGVLRFLCLIAVLENPHPPSLICIDEPEVGMHPDAMGILAEMVRSAATRTQVILTTHSPQFLDFFAPEEIIIVEKEKDESTFKRLSDKPMLDKWLENFGIADLWLLGEAGGKMRSKVQVKE